MANTARSKTVTLANGSRVIVQTGRSRLGVNYKTVIVMRADGSTERKTYRRGGVIRPFGGPYGDDIPGWALK